MPFATFWDLNPQPSGLMLGATRLIFSQAVSGTITFALVGCFSFKVVRENYALTNARPPITGMATSI